MYRGKQIFTPKVKGAKNEKVKGPEPKLQTESRHSEQEHVEQKSAKGFMGAIQRSMRPKARSGMGGGSGGK